MTSPPDWLVERAALDELPPHSRDRVARADPRELADRIAALRADNAAELARHPAAPAVAQIEARVAAQLDARIAADARRRRRRLAWLGAATSAAAVVVVATRLAPDHAPIALPDGSGELEPTRAKGTPRLVAFRQAGDQAERLAADALVRPGDLLQLRYHPGGERYGVIASIDGAGVVTLHYPTAEDAPPEATAVSADATTLPHAYALDDAPRFERFFFVTSDAPIDVAHSLAALRAFAQRPDSATAALELPAGQHQWSLRLRKPSSPTPPLDSP